MSSALGDSPAQFNGPLAIRVDPDLRGEQGYDEAAHMDLTDPPRRPMNPAVPVLMPDREVMIVAGVEDGRDHRDFWGAFRTSSAVILTRTMI